MHICEREKEVEYQRKRKENTAGFCACLLCGEQLREGERRMKLGELCLQNASEH